MILEMAVGGVIGYLVGSSRKKAQSNPIEGRGYDVYYVDAKRNRWIRAAFAPTLAMAKGKSASIRKQYRTQTKIMKRAA